MAEPLSYTILFAMFIALWVGFSSSVRDTAGVKPLVSANSLLMILFAVYIFFSATLSTIFSDFEFWLAPNYSGAERALPILGVSLLAIVSYIGGYSISTQRKRTGAIPTPLVSPEGGAPETLSVMIALGFAAIGMALKFYLIISAGGIASAITLMSHYVSNDLGASGGGSGDSIIRDISGIADVSITWLMVRSLRLKRYLLPYAALFAFLCVIVYLGAGKRQALFQPLVTVFIAYYMYSRRVSLTKLPLMLGSVFAFGIASMYIRDYLPAYYNNYDVNLDDVAGARHSLILAYFYSLEFSTFETMTAVMNESEAYIRLFGSYFDALYSVNFEQTLYIVPRFIWPDKPLMFYDFSHGCTAIVFGLPLGAAVWGTASAYIAVAWVFGGPLGVVVASGALGLAARYSDTQMFSSPFQKRASSIVLYGITLFFLFTLFRHGTLGGTFDSVVINNLGYLLGYLILNGFEPRTVPKARKIVPMTAQA